MISPPVAPVAYLIVCPDLRDITIRCQPVAAILLANFACLWSNTGNHFGMPSNQGPDRVEEGSM